MPLQCHNLNTFDLNIHVIYFLQGRCMKRWIKVIFWRINLAFPLAYILLLKVLALTPTFSLSGI